jgi:hypothetical protein
MKELEGDEDWEYKYVEIQGEENPKMADKETRDSLQAERQQLAKEIQDVTIEWIRASFKKETATLSTTEEKRNELVEKLRAQYWVIDPYVRARSFYDRTGIVKGDGKIEFYPGTGKKDASA